MLVTRRRARVLATCVVAALGTATVGAGAASASTDTTDPSGTATTGATTGGSTADTTGATTGGSTAGTTGESSGGATTGTIGDPMAGSGSTWEAPTDDCVDPDAANAPIEGEVFIGSAMPLSNSPAAAAFAPVAQGYQAYVDYANENGLLPDHPIRVSIGDDQYNPELTPGVVEGLLDEGANLFSSIIGTPGNAAVRDLLNEECVPQLLALTGAPVWGLEAEEYPWTIGGLLPYDIETKVYVEDIQAQFPDGARVGVFYANNDFGQAYKAALDEVAGDANIEVVSDQTIEPADTAPPQAQLSSIAAETPDVIIAAPLGVQCPVFMAELANAKAATPDWNPRVYITNTCASPLILAVAGESANGLFTSAGGGGAIDVGNPEVVAASPAAQEFVAYMEAKGLGDIVTTGAAGWIQAETAVQILRQAAASPDGLSQASIIEAARNLNFHPSLIRDGINFRTNGLDDTFMVESVQVVQYDAANAIFTDVGEVNTEFETQ